MQQPVRQAAVRFIFLTALMDVVSLGIMIPVLPNLVKELAGADTASAAHWAGLFGTTWAAMQFVCSPIMGMISDRYGRRPVLLVSTAGLGIDFLFMALAPTLPLLLIGRVINGITAASFSTAGAYIADVTPAENRAKAFGMIGAAWGVGFVIGPGLGGLLGEIDLRLPFYFSAGMALINFCYGYFVLPESLPPERRATTLNWKKANPLGALELLRSREGLLRFAAIIFLFQLAHAVLPAIFVLYSGHRYGWKPSMNGLALVASGICSIIVQALLVGRVVKRIGEKRTLLLGLMGGVLGYAAFGFAPSPIYYWLTLPVFALMGFTQPGLMGLMTRLVQPNEQGRLQGANASVQGLTGLIGPGLFTTTLAWAVSDPSRPVGAPLFIASVLMVVAVAIALPVKRA